MVHVKFSRKASGGSSESVCSENMKELDSWAVFLSGHQEEMQNASNGKFAEAEEVRK